MTENDIIRLARLVDKSLGMLDLPDGEFLWSRAEQINGEWVFVVDLGKDSNA
jgi:hypothetical protein